MIIIVSQSQSKLTRMRGVGMGTLKWSRARMKGNEEKKKRTPREKSKKYLVRWCGQPILKRERRQ